ncbi:hypothetical protein DW805_07370 [Ruminococcus sp. AM32-17LB]|nr:hypothetical protein DW805_07370 [Ruminococcus sp. AM32-17LB]
MLYNLNVTYLVEGTGLYSGFSLFAYSKNDNRTDVIQIVKEYEINLSEKGWYYVAAKISE